MNVSTNLTRRTAALFALMFTSTMVFASTSGDTSNPIISILKSFMDMATGPIATMVGIICVAGGGLYIALSGDISQGGKKVAMIIIGVGIAIGAVNLLKAVGVTGALI